jgi:hypothetical protein
MTMDDINPHRAHRAMRQADSKAQRKTLLMEGKSITDMVELHVADALQFLGIDRKTVAPGIYTERTPVLMNLGSALASLREARDILDRATRWPGPADYDPEPEEGGNV